MEELRAHPNCRRALFLPPRPRFEVYKGKEKGVQSLVRRLKKSRDKRGSASEVKAEYGKTVSKALEYLSEGDGAAASVETGDD